MNKTLASILLVLTLSLMQGCAGGLIVIAGTAVAVGSDERSISEQLKDDSLSLEALDKINELNLNTHDMRINLISNSGYILIVGQVSSQQISNRIEQSLNTITEAKGVYNQLRIGRPIGFAQQSKDSWITTKVKSKLAAHSEVDPLKIKVITENAEVFLIGRVDPDMSNFATNITRKVDGVKQVNRVFQIIE
jgi:osmotically-inducible protein OsmY